MAKANKALILRTSNRDRKSYGDFQWPESGPVEAPDWKPTPECGNGLHGALWGEGDGALFNWSVDATWQVVEVDADSVIDLDEKVKFPRGTVVYSGDRKGALKMILSHPGGKDRAVIGATVTAEHKAVAGYRGTARAGDYGTATAGHHGIATAGDFGKASAGYIGTATAGYMGKATAEDWGTATAGDSGTAAVGKGGTATTGDFGTAIAGIGGRATAGYEGTATAGHRGKATVGNRGAATAGAYGTAITGVLGTATAGDHGVASAGDHGSIYIKWYDQKTERPRLSTGYIGENGLLPDTLYKVDDEGNFVLAKPGDPEGRTVTEGRTVIVYGKEVHLDSVLLSHLKTLDGLKIPAIKATRKATGLLLKDAKLVVDQLWDEWKFSHTTNSNWY